MNKYLLVFRRYRWPHIGLVFCLWAHHKLNILISLECADMRWFQGGYHQHFCVKKSNWLGDNRRRSFILPDKYESNFEISNENKFHTPVSLFPGRRNGWLYESAMSNFFRTSLALLAPTGLSPMNTIKDQMTSKGCELGLLLQKTKEETHNLYHHMELY